MAVTDFTALDVETANPDFASICSIGLVHFKNNEAFKALTILVDPDADSVTKKTTILVVGDQDLRLTKGQEKSSKHRKCEQLIAAGQTIKIVRETDFTSMCS